MKRSLFKSLFVATTALLLFTTAGLLSITSCSKDIDFVVSGTVKDSDGTKLSDVTVSCDGVTTKTNKSGKYSIECANPSSIIYFEKADYISTAINDFSYEKSLDVVLTPFSDGTDKELTITVKNAKNEIIPSCSVGFYPDSSLYYQHKVTSEDGKTTITFRVANEGDTCIPFVINNASCDPHQQIFSINKNTSDCTLTAIPYQYDVNAFVSNDNAANKIVMHAYHSKDNNSSSFKVSFVANYLKAFDSKQKYTLTFNVNKTQSSPKLTTLTGKDFSIDFTSSGVVDTHGDIVSSKDKNSIEVKLSKSKMYLDVIIPASFYNFSSQGTIGIHLSGKDGTFQPFDHKSVSTSSSNQLCYVRLDEDNSLYQASDNVNPFGDLNWDTKTGSEWIVPTLNDDVDYLGRVGAEFNFGYKIKLARKAENADGIYILTKYIQPQMSHYLPDIYRPHFFFDVHEYGAGEYPKETDKPIDDGKVIHYSPYSGYWLQKHKVTSDTSAMTETYEYNDIFDKDEARIYSKEDLMITYIPYSSLGDDFTSETEFGFACNLQFKYTGDEWQKWTTANPTGFTGTDNIGAEPHFEHLMSYIRFDYDFEVIQYNPS